MILVEVHSEENEQLARVWMRQAPQKGDLLWFTGEDQKRLADEQGTSSFRVTEVAHWVHSGWSPNTHVGAPIHTVCVYVDPLARLGTSRKAEDVQP